MTKLLALAAPALAAALALTAGAAAAENTFSLDRARSTAASLALANVQADQAGSVEVYSYENGNIGQFLGGAPVAAGTTGAVDVALSRPLDGRILVVLMNSNHSVAKLDTRADTAALTN
jgi:hypothetical protein